MKRILNQNLRIVLTLLLLAAFSSTFAKEEFEKTLADKKITVNKTAILHIEHKYGELKCKNWTENAVSVKVIARADVSGYEKAEKIFSGVKVDISGDPNLVSIRTTIQEKWFNNGNNDLSVDIEIYMPASLTLELDHQFGSAYIETIEGKCSIKSEYGNIEIKSLKNEINDIEISFGKGLIREMNMGEIEVNYSELTITKALNLNLETSYSTFSNDEVSDLEIDQEGGNCSLGKVDNIDVQSKFSDFKVDMLQKSMVATTEYGNLTVRNIAGKFSKLTVKNSFGAVELNFEEGTSFTIEAEMEFCTLDYPNNADFSKRIISPTESYYKGVIGTNKQPSATVNISSDYGGVEIDFN